MFSSLFLLLPLCGLTTFLFFDMFVRKQMILAIFIISVAFGTETEFEIITVQLGSASDRTLVLGNTGSACLTGLPFEILLPTDFFW